MFHVKHPLATMVDVSRETYVMVVDILFKSLNAGVMILLPLVLAGIFARGTTSTAKLLGLGVLTFLGAQALHIPFNRFLLIPWLAERADPGKGVQASLLLRALALGLSAAVFEEGARFGVFRFWLRGRRSWGAGALFGLGHGGVEAVLLGLLALVALLQAWTLQRGDLPQLLAPENVSLARAQLEVYWRMPWYASLMGAIERVSALSFHIAAAVFVQQAVHTGRIRWLVIAVGGHTALNAAAVFGSQTWGVYATEGILFGMGILSLAAAYAFRRDEEQRPPENHELDLEKLHIKPQRDQVDDSRYV